jgi:biofilm PGA synthesis N-glycosyltransferase PgaC
LHFAAPFWRSQAPFWLLLPSPVLSILNLTLYEQKSGKIIMTYLPMVVFFVLLIVVAGLGLLDRNKYRPLSALPPLSFIIPCYNDAGSVDQTVESIFSVYGPDADVVVIDDGSTDGSREKLAALKERLGFTLVFNSSNIGKSKTLNDHFHLARHDIVVFVDADVIVARKPLMDAIARLQFSGVGAVSCPYRAANPGVLPLMQTIEYNMLTFIQGAYNVFSAIALWGGFIAIKRKAFLDVNGFTLNAITEDKDLAFKLNLKGWKVEQSFCHIRTYVPETMTQLFKQKIRWSSGGLQCFIRYYKVLMKNPLQLLFTVAFCILLTGSMLNLGKNIHLWDDIFNYFFWVHSSKSLLESIRLTVGKFGVFILKDLSWRISFTLFSLPFALPLVSTLKRLYVCFLVIPFSIFYVPAFSLISIAGAVHLIRKRNWLQRSDRAW